MIRGKQLWWKRGRATLPAVFECWRRQKLAAVVLTPYDGRSHEALVPLLSPAVDADAWAARVAELRAAELAVEGRQRLLDSKVGVGALVRELELVPGSKRIRERTIEAVLAAARRLEAPC